MSDLVTITRNGSIAIVSIENPPVNALGHEVRTGIYNAMEQLAADDTVAGVVLTGSGQHLQCRCRYSRIRQAVAGTLASRRYRES